ncbi:MAG: EamA family transporter [Ilumatobacteraceae bacterium]|nr:EamA family transporter [Ilumatobacteraceae bacterium]
MVLWSTGFVVAHYATEDAGPLTFLTVRLAGAGLLLWIAATVLKAPPIDRTQVRWATIAGLGMNALYLGGVFVAIHLGLPTGLSSLITGIHPVLTSIAARWVLRERIRRVQWIGIALGLAGVVAVVVDRLSANSAGVTAGALVAMGVSVVGMSAGTLVQRSRGATMPLLRGTAVQFATSAIVLGVGAVLNEHWRFHPSARLWFSLGWAMFVLSIASVLIMLMLLQRQAAARVSSLFFLTPALSTIEGAWLFREHIGAIVVVGLGISLAGVFLATRPPRPALARSASDG